MPTPQIEDGFTRVANELMEALIKYKCPGNQKDIIWALIRQSYGYQKTEAPLSIGYLSRKLNKDKAGISRNITALVKKNVLILKREASFSKARRFSINKDYTKWKQPNGRVLTLNRELIERQPKDCQNINPTVAEVATNKENIKENLNKTLEDAFEKFWIEYPNGELGNRGSKKRAYEVFCRTITKVTGVEDLIAVLQAQIQHKQDLLRQKKFCPQFPHAERWLRNERWTDDLPEDNTKNKLHNFSNIMEKMLNED